VFNISSDAIMLLIPVPFITKVKVPPLKRALLASIFSLGIFVILAAVLHKYYNFSMPNTTVYMLWDIRETSTSVYVANIMCWWPLLRKIFGWRAFLMSGSSGKNDNGALATPVPKGLTTRSGTFDHSISSASLGKDGHPGVSGFQQDSLELQRSESQETINRAYRLRRIEEEHEDSGLPRKSGSTVTEDLLTSLGAGQDIEKCASTTITTWESAS
jgi:hypothetical protein